jgi:hypothetical protein
MHKRVFISYARSDAIPLAQRLHESLTAEGFDVWLDTSRLLGGASWTTELESVLDGCDVLLAVLTPGSYKSEICRAEQLRSLRNGKFVIPILGRARTPIPVYLETRNYRDFTRATTWAEEFGRLLQDLRDPDNAIRLPD